MASIHEAIINHVSSGLETALITSIADSDAARAGVVIMGRLQGDPDPDEARISVTVHENDPDGYRGLSGVTGLTGSWEDEVIEVEMGAGRPIVTWARRFTVNARCLLEPTGEELNDARAIASLVRERIETALLDMSFTGIQSTTGERVTREIGSNNLRGETLQSGGPEAYDFLVKVRFDVQTTTTR